jgi:hypothetical protein
MSNAPPELAAIIDQVAAEIAAMMAVGENGTVTIYIGPNQLQVETVAKRKQEPVRIEQRDVTIIRRVR